MTTAAIDLAEFKSGWKILILGLVGMAISVNASLLYSFGALVIPLETAFGWSRGEVQASVSFLYLGAIFGLQLVGWLNSRLGAKRLAIISFILITATYGVIMLNTGSILALYVAVFLLPILGAGCLAVTWTQIISLWFSTNRGLALAIGLSGTGLAASFLPPLISWGVALWDWRAGFAILAAINLLIALPLTLIWYRLPRVMAAKADAAEPAVVLEGLSFWEAARKRQFWILTLALSLLVSAIVALVISTIPMLRDRGFGAQEASSIFATLGLALIGGRMVVGYLLDRLPAILVSAIALAIPAIGCLIFLSGLNTPVLLMLAAFLVGLGAGGEFDIAAFITARYFGLRDYAKIFGLHLGFVTAASAAAPLMVAAMLGEAVNYTPVLLYCLACFIIGPALLLLMGKAAPQIQQPAASI